MILSGMHLVGFFTLSFTKFALSLNFAFFYFFKMYLMNIFCVALSRVHLNTIYFFT